MVNPEIPKNARHTRKYPKYPEIPESKKDTRKYPILYFNTPTQREPDPLPGFCPIPDPTQPDIEKPYPLGTDSELIFVATGGCVKFLTPVYFFFQKRPNLWCT